jgi:chaperonin GroES
MKFKPLHDWAVLKVVEDDSKTAGGLYIPDTAREKPQKGIVEAIGPGSYEDEYKWKRKKKAEKEERKYIPTVVKPGQTVLFEKYASNLVVINDKEKTLVREKNILAIIE